MFLYSGSLTIYCLHCKPQCQVYLFLPFHDVGIICCLYIRYSSCVLYVVMDGDNSLEAAVSGVVYLFL